MDISKSTFIDNSALAIAKQNMKMKNISSKNSEEVHKTAEDFEAFFLSKMMDTMFETVPTDGPFGGGSAEKIYRSLLTDEYGKSIAKAGGVGVADHVMDTILQMQEAQSSANKGVL